MPKRVDIIFILSEKNKEIEPILMALAQHQHVEMKQIISYYD